MPTHVLVMYIHIWFHCFVYLNTKLNEVVKLQQIKTTWNTLLLTFCAYMHPRDEIILPVDSSDWHSYQRCSRMLDILYWGWSAPASDTQSMKHRSLVHELNPRIGTAGIPYWDALSCYWSSQIQWTVSCRLISRTSQIRHTCGYSCITWTSKDPIPW